MAKNSNQPRAARPVSVSETRTLRRQAVVKTNLSQALETTSGLVSYDTNVKFLLADKQILAWILKYAVREFSDMPLKEAAASIDDRIEVGTRSLEGHPSDTGRIRGENTEDAVPAEGKIFYDLRFTATHKHSQIKFLINLEAQRSSDPGKLGYHLENRILFYLARMISAQKQTEFFHSDYDSLKRVRSIWICMGSREDGDSMEEIYLDRKTVFGKEALPFNADLMRAIIIHIRRGHVGKASRHRLISMLERLFSDIDVETKKRILTDEYGMIMTTQLEGRLQTMCNLSENILEEGIERGIEQGLEQGIDLGIDKERLQAIDRMLNAGASKAQILSYGYTEEELAKVTSK